MIERSVSLSLMVATAAVGLGLAACQPSGGAASSAASSATSAAAASSAASEPTSQTGETPKAFVNRLLTPYQPNGQWWASTNTPAQDKAQKAFQTAYYADFYDPDFEKLIDDNGALASKKADGPDMDYDPLCQCQDAGAIYSYVSGHADGAHYDVSVTSNDKEQGTWTLVLVDTPKSWRVWNVIDTTGDVRAMLTRHNACLRAAKTQDEGGKCLQG